MKKNKLKFNRHSFCSLAIQGNNISNLMFIWCVFFCFNQENVGKREVDAADCKTVYLSEYVIISF